MNRETAILLELNKRMQNQKPIEKHFTLKSCPQLQLMILVIEDRAKTLIADLVQWQIQNSRFKADPYVLDLCRKLYNPRNRNVAKKGIMGKYEHTLEQNLTDEEQVMLGDILSEYDEVIKASEKPLLRKFREIARKSGVKECDLDLLSKICMAEFASMQARDVHLETKERLPSKFVFYLGNMLWSETPFESAVNITDKLAGYVSGGIAIDFNKSDEGFCKILESYSNTLSKTERLVEQYDRAGINKQNSN